MDENKVQTEPIKFDEKSFKYKRNLGFGIFGIFFTYYITSAIIQAPEFQSISSIPLFDMPLGFVLSMGVFPISWILLTIFFTCWR